MNNDESNEFIPEDMDTAEKNIRPEFLGGSGDSVESDSKVEPNKVAQESGEGKGSGGFYNKSAKDELKKNEDEASEGLYKPGKTKDDIKEKEESGGKIFSKKIGGKSKKKGMLNGKRIAKLSAVLLVFLLIFVACIVVLNIPSFLIGNLDFNLMESTGFTGTVGVLEEQAEYVEQEMAKNGELPANLANDLADAGLSVGQVTAAGDFVKTNKYIANIEDLDEVAVLGSGFYTHGDEGELAFLFEGELIDADDFVLAVETNPKLYAAFSEGTNISAKYYYSDDVNNVYKTLGISRNAFMNWKSSGSYAADKKKYEEILKGILDGEKTTLSGSYDCSEDESAGCDSANFSGKADQIISGLKKNESAAQLLNSALASTEKNNSMRSFMAIEEPAQRTRIEGEELGSLMMETLSDDSKKIAYTDVLTGMEVESNTSIIDTTNFVAAVSGGGFDKHEAANFSNDRVLKVTDSSSSLIKKTGLSSDGRKKVKIGVGLFGGEDKD